MINKEQIIAFFQNKNFMMTFIALIFMSGVLACFYGFGLAFAGIITFLLILLLSLKIFSIRQILFFAFIFYFGFFLTFCKVKNYDELLPLTPINDVFVGRVVSIPVSQDKEKVKFFMETEKIGSKIVSGKTFVSLSVDKTSMEKLNIGDKISIKGNLRIPFNSTNPSQFDYSEYLRNFNVFTVLYSDDANFKVLDENLSLKWKFLQGLNKTRNKILKTHSKYLKSPNLEILGGIVFGDDAVAPPEYIKHSFINSGLLHILAASGMNVSFIFTFWLVILGLFKVPYKPKVLSGMFIIILYTLMTGLGASVIRAALMLLFVLAGKLMDRDANSVSLLSLVAVLMLIYNPAYINNVSFQLSFLVTFGLLTTANIVSQKLSNLPKWVVIPILIPLVAQIWIAPIQMFYFNSFSLYSILANISTVCLLSVISFCGFISSVISVITPIADFTCKIFDFGLNYLLNILVFISNFFANLPHCIIQTTHPHLVQVFIYYVMLLLLTFLIKYDKFKESLITFIVMGLVVAGMNFKVESKDLEVIAFDVQNADSFLIKTPKNKYFFIDTGKAPYRSGNSQAKIIMLKYLKDRGIKNIEGIVVTHFDNDHSGGTVDFLENTKVNTLYLNSTEASTETARKIFKTIDKNNQKMIIAQNNRVIYNEPDLKISTYKANLDGKNKSNDCSIITLLTYKNFDMLFMGDAGIDSFNALKSYFPNNVEVLKVGHHGGPKVVDEDMINYLGSKVSVVSTGINSFGHPNKGTLDVLRNTKILRTDLLNSIKISTNGNKYKIYSYDNHDKKYRIKELYLAK